MNSRAKIIQCPFCKKGFTRPVSQKVIAANRRNIRKRWSR